MEHDGGTGGSRQTIKAKDPELEGCMPYDVNAEAQSLLTKNGYYDSTIP